MGTGQHGKGGQVDDGIGLAPGVVVEHAVLGVDPALDAPQAGHEDDVLLALGAQFLGHGAPPFVVDADHGGARRRLPVKDHLQGLDITVLVGIGVEQHRHVEGQGNREPQHGRRHAKHVGAVIVQGMEAEHGHAEASADFRLVARRLHDVADERRRRRLAKGAGDPDVRRIPVACAPATRRRR